MHIGHAMFVAIEDILIRYHRMCGEATLWLPGTDHGVLRRSLCSKRNWPNKARAVLILTGRLYKMIAEYVDENSGVAIEQMKRLGASADWDRFKFTLDPEIIKEVLKTFEKLNQDGLIYRAMKLVNYCTKCGTAYSELEVEYEEKNDPFITLNMVHLFWQQ